MFVKVNKLIALVLCLLCVSCGAVFNQPVTVSEAILGESTQKTEALKKLPPAKEKIVVGVYNFRDQTGQYKMIENGSSFSTAVTQGATTILLKALEDSKWFKAIERENLNNLLNERNIIRSTRQEYRKTSKTDVPELDPLLYAGILLEGGIISYDSNIITGGVGARYFGVGGSTKYRQDRITIYLRAVSTSSGEVLKTIYVSKTILFQALDASFFRYVKFKRLLEVETGITKKEPLQMAVTEAIEKAVESLVIEGLKDRLWPSAASDEDVKQVIALYEEEKTEAENRQIYDRLIQDKRAKNAFELSAGGTYLDGDYSDPKLELMAVSVGYKRSITPYMNLGLSYEKFNLATKEKYNYKSTYGFMSFDLKAELTVLPYDNLSPYIYVAGGLNASNYFKEMDPKTEFGVGLEYLASKKIGFKVYGGHNQVYSDMLDGIQSGKRDDFYWKFGIGINYYLSKSNRPMNDNGRQMSRKEYRLKKRLDKANRKNNVELNTN
ncbi:MAG: CsgG/HfaB family protein [Flavobacteriaceae bacterium]